MRRRGPAAFASTGADPASEDVAFWAQAGALGSNGAGGAGGAGQEGGLGVLPIGADGDIDYGGFDGGDYGGGELTLPRFCRGSANNYRMK